MNINCNAWNPSMQKTMHLARWLVLEHYKDPVNATDNAINSVITALRADGCNPDDTTTITLPLDEYHLLISDAQIKAREEGCKEGREEAWDLARRVVAYGPDCYTGSDFDSVFGSCNATSIFEMPVDEALAKDNKYQEEKKALHVGDEVEFGAKAIASKKYRGFITDFVPQNTVRVLTKELGTIRVEPEDCKKTGKHSDEIEKVMASFEKGE